MKGVACTRARVRMLADRRPCIALPRRPYGQTKAQKEAIHQHTPDTPTPHHAVTVKEETVMSRIQDIPEAERRALEDLYDRCGGRSWKKSDGWKTGASKWHGVTVENRHVVKISLNNNGLIGGAFDVDVGSGEEGGVCAKCLFRSVEECHGDLPDAKN